MKVVTNPSSREDLKYSLFDDRGKRITTTGLDNLKKILKKSYQDSKVTGLPGSDPVTVPVEKKPEVKQARATTTVPIRPSKKVAVKAVGGKKTGK